MTGANTVRSSRRIGLSFAARYPATVLSCAQVRGDVVKFLSDASLGDDVVEVGQLVAQELAVNGVTHHEAAPGEELGVSVRLVGSTPRASVVIAVRDGGPGRIGAPRAEADDADEHGRGLMLLRGLGARLHGHVVKGGYLVRAHFPVDAGLRERVCRCDCVRRGHDDPGVCSRLLTVEQASRNVVPGFEDWPVCEPCLMLSILPDTQSARGVLALAGAGCDADRLADDDVPV